MGAKHENSAMHTPIRNLLRAIGRIIVVLFALDIVFVLCFVPTTSQEKLAKESGLGDRQFLVQACDTKRTCAKYSEALQACATAGNIGQCVGIKMGDKPYGSCAASGTTDQYPGALAPNFMQCIFN